MTKIKFTDAQYILRRKKPHRIERLCCYWTISAKGMNSGKMKCKVHWLAYILLFLPVHLVELGTCLWDGGLKTFTFASRTIHNYNVVGFPSDGEDTQFGCFMRVWERVSKK